MPGWEPRQHRHSRWYRCLPTKDPEVPLRNFFLFIRRFFNLILFLTLEVICCVLIARTNTLQGNELLNSSNAVSGYFYKQQNALTYYFRLRQMNDSLINENQRLHMEIAGKYYTTDTLRDKLVTRIVQPADSLHVVQYASYIYREARVINNSVAKDNNHLTLNRGANDGIREGMAVISGNGVVGKVVHTSAHYADVLSILSEIQPRLKVFGQLGFLGGAEDGCGHIGIANAPGDR
ncbi:hypothetical protein OSTOST_10390 [Ostertagia ostertagi]